MKLGYSLDCKKSSIVDVHETSSVLMASIVLQFGQCIKRVILQYSSSNGNDVVRELLITGTFPCLQMKEYKLALSCSSLLIYLSKMVFFVTVDFGLDKSRALKPVKFTD